jgi:hypothetical protein
VYPSFNIIREIETDEMGELCITWRNAYKIYVENLKGNYVEDLGVPERIA